MTTIRMTASTSVAPERVLGALTDFTPQRLQIWPNIDQRFYKVHAVHATSAEITEGSAFFGGVWERDHYDWSQPGYVTIQVQSSNTFSSNSYWKYHIMPGKNGGSDIEVTVHRVGKNLKGYVLATMLRVFGKRVFSEDLDKTLKHLESSPVTAH
jgi:hypothetical protein